MGVCQSVRSGSGCVISAGAILSCLRRPRGARHGRTEITRPQYRRDHLRYGSDATDEEWKVIAPHLPPPADCGRARETDLREVVNAIFYIAQTGCQWRLLPKDLPPYTTVQRYFYAWRDSGVWQTDRHHRPAGRDDRPSGERAGS